MVGYKETTEDGTETYKYKNPNNTSADDEYVPVSKEQYENLKEQQSGDPKSKYTKYEIKDGHYTETECEITAAGNEKALKETTQDENGVTTQIKENQYDENDNLVGYSIDHNDGNKEYYQVDGTGTNLEVGRANSDGTYEYLDKSSPDGAFVKVDEDKFNNLIAGEKTDPDNGNTVTYKIEDGNYIETTTNANDPDKVTRHTEYLDENSHAKYEDYTKENGKEVTTTTIKKGASEDEYEKITKTEENGNVTYSYQGKDDTTSKDVNLDENEYKNIIKGSDNDESTGKTTEYSIENGHYTETEKEGDNVTAVNTKPNGDNKNKPGEMVREERDKDGTTVKSRTCGDTSLTDEQAENLINGETKDGKSVYIDEKGNYSEAELNANQKPVYIEKQNSSGTKISDTKNTYDKNNALKQGVTNQYDSKGKSSTTTTTYEGTAGSEWTKEEKIEYYSHANNGEKVYRTNTKTYRETGNHTLEKEVATGTNKLNSDPDYRNYYNNSTMTTEYEADGKTIKSQTLVKEDGSQIIDGYTNNVHNKQTSMSKDGQEYTTRQLKNGQWETTDKRKNIGDEKNPSYWGYKNGGKNPADYEVPVIYKGEPELQNKETIDAIITSGKPPVIVDSTDYVKNTTTEYDDYLNNHENNSVIIFKNGTKLSYCLNNLNDPSYTIDVTTGENQNAYKIVGDKLVNVNNPDEWYYLDVLKKTSSRDSKRNAGTMSYSQLQNIRKNYHLSPSDEANLSDLGPKDILQKSYNNFEFPPNSGYPGDSSHTYVSQDVEAYHNDGTLISKDDILNATNVIPQDEIVWKVQFEDCNYYDFKPEKGPDGKTYYYCEISGKKMIYDPKTGKVYYY